MLQCMLSIRGPGISHVKTSEMLLIFLMLFWFCCFSVLTKNRDEMHGAFSGNFKYKVNLKVKILNIFTNDTS